MRNMNPRRKSVNAEALGLALLATLATSTLSRAADRPNILWITTEDISPDLHCYGDDQARTPTLDRLASEGVRFDNAFSVSGVCAPTRSCIITGMYPTSIGTHHMRCKGVPPAYVKCFTEYLRAAGYYCTNNVKTDYNFDSPDTAWDESSRQAHWRGRAPGQPFFAVINYTGTHESRIRASDEEFARLTQRLTADERHDPAQAQLPPYYPDTPVTRRDWTRYYDLITAMDKHVADILKQLDEDGLTDDTIVFFYGDHGRGLPRGKRWIYDSGMRVPLIVRWPGVLQPGTVRDDVVSFVDLAPTVLSLAGVDVPAHLQGQVILGPHAAPPREYVYAARDRMDEAYDIIRAVRDKRYKYIRNFRPEKPYAQHIQYMDQMPTLREMRRLNAEGQLRGPQALFFRPSKPVEELYDLSNDPHEIRNLAGSPQHGETLTRMRAALETWMRDVGDLGFTPEAALWEQRRPGGEWDVAATPRLSTTTAGASTQAVSVTITCETPGASIAYTTESGNRPHWKLYTRPVEITESTTLRTKACRLGFRDSPEVRKEIQIQ